MYLLTVGLLLLGSCASPSGGREISNVNTNGGGQEDNDGQGNNGDEDGGSITPESFTVRFNSMGGSAIADQTVVSGGTVIQPENPVRGGNSFNGWYTEAIGISSWNFDDDTVSKAMTLYAKWAAIPAGSFAVTFNTMGGSAVAGQTVVSGGTVTQPENPTSAGYAFSGWYTDTAYTTAWDFDVHTVTQAVILYAKWTADPAAEPGSPYTAGTYTATVPSRGGDLTATVEFTQSMIYAVSVIHTDTPSYAQKIPQMIHRIEDAQSVTVDAVSGATVSTSRVRNAVEDCLEQALVTKPVKPSGIGYDFYNNSGYDVTIEVLGDTLVLKPGDKKTVYSADGDVDFTPPSSGSITTVTEPGRTIFYMKN
jgi:uncharacterized repeat protein (TIGR02543 family)